MTKTQWLRIHARLARIYEAVEDAEIRAYLYLAMQTVDSRIAEIERSKRGR